MFKVFVIHKMIITSAALTKLTNTITCQFAYILWQNRKKNFSHRLSLSPWHSMFIVCSFSVMRNEMGTSKSHQNVVHRESSEYLRCIARIRRRFLILIFFFFETYVCHFYRLFSDYPHLLIVSSGVGRVYRMIIFIMACVFCTSQIFSLWNKSDYFIHFHYIKIEKAYKICSTNKSLI